MYTVTGRMELNVLDYNSAVPRVSEFAYKNRCPAIVVLPQLVPAFIADREAKKGNYRVIAAVDFGGTSFAMQKVRDMGSDATSADGYDIMCTPGRPANEILNEVRSVSDFLKSLNTLAEIRWVLGAYQRPYTEVQSYLNCFSRYQVSWLRLDSRIIDPKLTAAQHVGMVASIRRGCKLPLKISGNVNKEVTDSFMDDKSVRFDVTLDQANNILAAYNNQPAKKEEPKNVPPSAPLNHSEIDGTQITGTIGYDV
jgi:hypothetical protein